jgi:hypothetical protein
VYVFGYQVTEELLQTAFTPMGKIVNISMEVEKVGSPPSTNGLSIPGPNPTTS